MNNSVKTWVLILGIGGTLAVGGTWWTVRMFNDAKHVSGPDAIQPPTNDCVYDLRVGSNVIVSIDTIPNKEACNPTVVNGMPSPGHPCAWVVQISALDKVRIYYDLPEDSIPCDPPTPVCTAGPCL